MEFIPDEELPLAEGAPLEACGLAEEEIEEFFEFQDVRVVDTQLRVDRPRMTRGNQRDRDRERAQARNGNKPKGKDGLTPEQRRERDAKALQEKLAKKTTQAAAAPPNPKTTKK